MTTRLALLALLALPGPALAAEFSCNFTTECRETDACKDGDLTVTVSSEAKTMETDLGTVSIVAIRELSSIVNIFGNSRDGTWLLTVTEDGARLQAQTEKPEALTWIGTCEGAF